MALWPLAPSGGLTVATTNMAAWQPLPGLPDHHHGGSSSRCNTFFLFFICFISIVKTQNILKTLSTTKATDMEHEPK
jgi:hypothetical protein